MKRQEAILLAYKVLYDRAGKLITERTITDIKELKPELAQRYWSCLPIGFFKLLISKEHAFSIISWLVNLISKAFVKDVIKDKRNDEEPPNPEPPLANPKVFNSINFEILNPWLKSSQLST